MTRDFGSGRSPLGQRAELTWRILSHGALVSGLLLLASLPTMMAAPDAPLPEDPPAHSVSGQPCQAISEAKFDWGYHRPARVITYQGVAFARRSGDVSCVVRHEGLRRFPVCKFSQPIEVSVTADGETAYFEVGGGYTAIVEARREGVRCVVTGRFKP